MLVTLRLLLGILQKNFFLMQDFTRPIYEVATRLNHPG